MLSCYIYIIFSFASSWLKSAQRTATWEVTLKFSPKRWITSGNNNKNICGCLSLLIDICTVCRNVAMSKNSFYNLVQPFFEICNVVVPWHGPTVFWPLVIKTTRESQLPKIIYKNVISIDRNGSIHQPSTVTAWNQKDCHGMYVVLLLFLWYVIVLVAGLKKKVVI